MQAGQWGGLQGQELDQGWAVREGSRCVQGSPAERGESEGISGFLMLAESQGCILCDCPGSPCILIVYLVPATRVSGPEKPPCTGLAERSCSGL